MAFSLLEILEAREQRVLRQREFLLEGELPLVCFTLNIPGPEKDGPLIRKGFQLGLRFLRKALGGRILHEESRLTAAGWEAFLKVDLEPAKLKRITAHLEDRIPGGRVFDMDVLTLSGKMGRKELGLPERKCLLCDNAAVVCGRSRAHRLEDLEAETVRLLRAALAEEISRLAVQSLLCEVYATPKPGLVDQKGSGSHRDMDLFTFLSSAASLWPYFRRCAALGSESDAPEALFPKLRQAGLEAEETMLRATGGVNTHKGAIFTLGLLCGAAGMLSPEDWNPEVLCSLCAQMTHGLTQRELGKKEAPRTAGERIYQQHGIPGARGQAEAGFPGALLGLKALETCLAEGLSLNDALCRSLLAIMAATPDTNLIHRGGMEAQNWVWEILTTDPDPASLCPEFEKRNLSPGGSADLLAAACFLHFLT